MAVTITLASLRSAFPEWENTPDAVVSAAISVANAKPFDELYTDSDEETHRRHLEASAVLFSKPFARDMRPRGAAAANAYRIEADHYDQLKGAAYRAPGWTVPSGVS